MIYLATDHAGYDLKESIKKYLQDNNYAVRDCGAHSLDPEDDYPDFISQAAREVSRDPSHQAIIFGGSGQGEAIVANKYPNVRAVVFYGSKQEIPQLARIHNNANILSIGARFVSESEAIEAVKTFLTTEFTQEERHQRRINKIMELEKAL